MSNQICHNCETAFTTDFPQSVCFPCQDEIFEFLEDESYWAELAAELSQDR